MRTRTLVDTLFLFLFLKVGLWCRIGYALQRFVDLRSPNNSQYFALRTFQDEIMKELSEMYANVKDEKVGEFHNQIKAFVFALHWVGRFFRCQASVQGSVSPHAKR